ncbi:MAG: tRNA pseudouridine(55) synthase TruB [Hyphomicrobiales bacterium]
MSVKKKIFSFEEGEVLLVDKPLNWTSFNVVSSIKHAVKYVTEKKKIKVGHAGTLDPLATGLLILCTGKMTKQIEKFQAKEKEYTGTFVIGATTPCYDLEKDIDRTFDISHITEDMIRENVDHFIGEIEQTPPIFSAIKIDGKRAYDYARNDEEVKIKSRKVTISEFEITRIELPEIDFRVVCSKGTYIRSLARDFGESLSNGAYLKNLKRTRIGDFELLDAWGVNELKEHIRSLKDNKESKEIEKG